MINSLYRLTAMGWLLFSLPTLAMGKSLKMSEEIFIPEVEVHTFVVPMGIQVTEANIADLADKLKRRHISGLSLAGHAEVTDAYLAHLKTVPLQELDLEGTSVTGPGLDGWRGSLTLQKLSLKKTPFTNEGMRMIGRFKNLRVLSLNGTQIDDAGLKALKDLTQLQELDLSGTVITGEGFSALQGLQQLKILDLSHTSFQDTYLSSIRRLAGLQDHSSRD